MLKTIYLCFLLKKNNPWRIRQLPLTTCETFNRFMSPKNDQLLFAVNNDVIGNSNRTVEVRLIFTCSPLHHAEQLHQVRMVQPRSQLRLRYLRSRRREKKRNPQPESASFSRGLWATRPPLKSPPGRATRSSGPKSAGASASAWAGPSTCWWRWGCLRWEASPPCGLCRSCPVRFRDR